jgi:hypothetical protein
MWIFLPHLSDHDVFGFWLDLFFIVLEVLAVILFGVDGG